MKFERYARNWPVGSTSTSAESWRTLEGDKPPLNRASFRSKGRTNRFSRPGRQSQSLTIHSFLTPGRRLSSSVRPPEADVIFAACEGANGFAGGSLMTRHAFLLASVCVVALIRFGTAGD